jgi:hypothetical protein
MVALKNHWSGHAMGAVPKRHMTATEFEAVRPFLNISAERVEAARLVLVESSTMQLAGKQFGKSRQTVNDAVAVVWKIFGRFQAAQQAQARAEGLIPSGWEKMTVIAPSPMIARFRAEIAAVQGARAHLDAPDADSDSPGTPCATDITRASAGLIYGLA